MTAVLVMTVGKRWPHCRRQGSQYGVEKGKEEHVDWAGIRDALFPVPFNTERHAHQVGAHFF